MERTGLGDGVAVGRRALLTLSAVLVAAVAATAVAGDGRGDDGQGDDEQEGYAIGLWGDLPYNDVQALIGVPNLIDDMNRQRLKFTVHDGDLKGGNGIAGSTTPTTCADPLYLQALGFFGSLRAPAILTPGDNDWTDCDRPSNGSFDPIERLDHERALFFGDDRSLGQQRIQMHVQADPLCLDHEGHGVPCVENRRWHVGNVTYVTLNIQGSCNNLCSAVPTQADQDEWKARNAADIAWLQESFAVAKQRGSAAIMIVSQANPGWHRFENDAPKRDPLTLAQFGDSAALPDGFIDFLKALRTELVSYRKPVVYVHGDTHTFRIDKPFFDAAGRRFENFTRLETYGDNAPNGTNDVNWVKVLVDAGSREVFAFQPQIVPANRVAH